MEVKKFVVIWVFIILMVPSLYSEDFNGDLSKLPSKKDVIGFLDSLKNKLENDFFLKENVTRDLFIITGEINGSWLEDAMIKFYELNGIKYEKSKIEDFLKGINMPLNIQEAIAFLLYTYINISNNKNDIESIFFILYAIRKVSYIMQNYEMNKTIFGPYKKIVFGGDGNDFYNKNYTFIVEFGGNDSYNENNFVFDLKGNDIYNEMIANDSTYITIDENGNDKYKNACYSNNGSYFLIDLKGNDNYNGRICSSYKNGFSFLLDIKGNDNYKGGNYTQCFSSYGTSILIDFEGNDAYNANKYSQSSTIGGYSFFIDFRGDDIFIAKERSQAFASGGSIGGLKGFSMLINFAGSDYYSSGNYSQGYSYNFGFATLIDFLGDDIYNANKFSQASSNLMGISALIDSDGKNKFHHGVFSQGYMFGGISFFMDNFEMKGNEKILEMLNKLNFDFSQFFG